MPESKENLVGDTGFELPPSPGPDSGIGAKGRPSPGPVRYGGMRRFRLDRQQDVTGVSGTGCVAQGVVFSDGTVVMRWLTEHRSTAVYADVSDLEVIHLHHGATVIRWQDPICFFCGGALIDDEEIQHHCFGCGAGQGPSLCYATRPPGYDPIPAPVQP